jgi:hypothetical protein
MRCGLTPGLIHVCGCVGMHQTRVDFKSHGKDVAERQVCVVSFFCVLTCIDYIISVSYEICSASLRHGCMAWQQFVCWDYGYRNGCCLFPGMHVCL